MGVVEKRVEKWGKVGGGGVGESRWDIFVVVGMVVMVVVVVGFSVMKVSIVVEFENL